MANEKRLIDANALMEEIDFEYDLNYGEILTDPVKFADMVDNAPTVDAVEVVHGRWIYEPVEFTYEKDIKCSICGRYNECPTIYCPNCGAKMDGDSHA